MYTALYRACRPEVFSEILGQEHVVKILKNQIATDSVSHAYLFCGTRGTGKTTTARILAKAVNCLSDGEKPCGSCANCRAISSGSFMDVIEIDAASNNGVDNVRELRESVKYPPSAGRKKVYIIDEVHMLSAGAFNALLKTLEEPPEHVMFILATTEPQKLPATILSRCMRLDFKRVPQHTLAESMISLCRDREVTLQEDAALLLANCADGSVRDGLSILDQVLAGGDKLIDRDKVLEYVGTTGEEFFLRLTELVSGGRVAEALILLDEALRDGKDVKQIMKDWVSHYRSLLIAKFVQDPQDMLNTSAENIQELAAQSKKISFAEIDGAVTLLSRTVNDARWSTNPRVLLELAIVSIASAKTAATQAAAEPPAARPAPRAQATQAEQPAPRAQAPQPESAPAQPQQPAQYAPQPAQVTEAAQQPAPQPAAPQPAAPQPVFTPENDELWQSIFEEGSGLDAAFNLIKGGTRLSAMDEDSFTIIANSSFTKRYAEQRRSEIEALVEERTGKRRRMICLAEGEQQAAKDDEPESDAKDLVKEAEALLGINIELE